jgi:hypothetical protein
LSTERKSLADEQDAGLAFGSPKKPTAVPAPQKALTLGPPAFQPGALSPHEQDK